MMMSNNLISIVIPVYNGEQYIGKAIESCLRQSEQQGWEVIVVNDGSTDNSVNIIDRYLNDPRVKLVSHENKGLPTARNTGIVNSSGNFIAFLDADDCFFPDTMKHYHEACCNASVSMFYCNYLRINGQDKVTGSVRVKPPMKRPDLHLQFLLPKLYPILPSTTLVRIDAIEQVGMFDERFLGCEDLQFFARISEKYELAKLDFFSSGRRMHDDQMTKDRKSIIYWREEFNLEYLKRHDFCYFCSTHDRTKQAELAEHFGDLMINAQEPLKRTASYLYELSLSIRPFNTVKAKLARIQASEKANPS